jgi:hypothetical protein
MSEEESDVAAQPEAIIDPTALNDLDDNPTLAPRLGALHGRTAGLLFNGKANGGVLLEEFGEYLKEHHGLADYHLFTKGYFGTPLEDELVPKIVESSEFVITAVGDCGSCSAATVADGIILERAGLPTVSVLSDAFRLSGQAMARNYGFPGFEYLTVPHPVSSLSRDEVRAAAHKAIPRLLEILGVE